MRLKKTCLFFNPKKCGCIDHAIIFPYILVMAIFVHHKQCVSSVLLWRWMAKGHVAWGKSTLFCIYLQNLNFVLERAYVTCFMWFYFFFTSRQNALYASLFVILVSREFISWADFYF